MNIILKNELIAMVDEDQRILKELHDNGELGTVEYHPKIKKIHEKNNRRIKEIIAEVGWPGIDLVGEDGAEAAWLIVQHAVLDTDFMKSCLPLLEKAVANKQAKGHHLAFLHDRIMTMSGRPQKYGTQFDISENGEVTSLPIENSQIVDKLREEIGLESLAERTKQMQEIQNERIKNRTK
jgi:hypothetical protein